MKRIIGMNSNTYHNYSIKQAIEGTKKAGFQYMELTATKGWTEHVFPTMSLRDLYEVRDMLKEAGIKAFAMSGHTNLMDKARINDFLANIRLASFMGCQYIVSSIGEAHLEDKAVASDEIVAEHIRALLPFLDDNGLILALENHGEHGSGKRLKGIVDLVEAPNVVINYDTANALFYGDVDLAEDIDACIDKIGFVHLKDKAGGRAEWKFPALGEGYIDFPMIIQKLKEAGNDAPFSIEIEFTQSGAKDLQEVNQAVQTSYDYLKRIGLEV